MTSTTSMNSIQNLNPSTGELIAEIPCAGAEEVRAAVARARAAQPAWEALGLEERCRVLSGIADGLAEHADELADLVTREMGKPLAQATAEAEKCALVCRYYADHAERLLADEPRETEAARSFVAYEPLGPVLAVMPWNFFHQISVPL